MSMKHRACTALSEANRDIAHYHRTKQASKHG
jgi:hypothetical protein